MKIPKTCLRSTIIIILSPIAIAIVLIALGVLISLIFGVAGLACLHQQKYTVVTGITNNTLPFNVGRPFRVTYRFNGTDLSGSLNPIPGEQASRFVGYGNFTLSETLAFLKYKPTSCTYINHVQVCKTNYEYVRLLDVLYSSIGHGISGVWKKVYFYCSPDSPTNLD